MFLRELYEQKATFGYVKIANASDEHFKITHNIARQMQQEGFILLQNPWSGGSIATGKEHRFLHQPQVGDLMASLTPKGSAYVESKYLIAESRELAKKALENAQKANDIAKKANKYARIANIIAIISLAIALFSIIINNS